MDSNLSSLLDKDEPKHILYAYDDTDKYIDHVVEYIETGVKSGIHVLYIESLRVFPNVKKKLEELLTIEEMELVHHVNNFDFYFSSGSYHPPSILEYFNRTVQYFKQNKIPFQSWAHVEWNTMKEPFHLIEDFENAVDEAVHEMSFSLICAYKRALMPAHLQQILLKTHPYIYMDEKVYETESERIPQF